MVRTETVLEKRTTNTLKKKTLSGSQIESKSCEDQQSDGRRIAPQDYAKQIKHSPDPHVCIGSMGSKDHKKNPPALGNITFRCAVDAP